MYEGYYDSTRSDLYITATANASGIAQGFIGPVSPGYAWYVERMTTYSTSAQSSVICEVFVQPQATLDTAYSATAGSRQYRQDLSLAGKNDVADERSPIFVNENQYLVVGWTGLANGDVVQFSTQVRVHLKSLRIEEMQLQAQNNERAYIDAPTRSHHEGSKGLMKDLSHGLHSMMMTDDEYEEKVS